jgi:hypothetical protein
MTIIPEKGEGRKKKKKLKNPVENRVKRLGFQLPSRRVCHFVGCFAFLLLKIRGIGLISFRNLRWRTFFLNIE